MRNLQDNSELSTKDKLWPIMVNPFYFKLCGRRWWSSKGKRSKKWVICDSCGKRCRPQWRFLLWWLFRWKLTLLKYQYKFPCFDFAKVLLNRYNIQVMLFCHAFDLQMGFIKITNAVPLCPRFLSIFSGPVNLSDKIS